MATSMAVMGILLANRTRTGACYNPAISLIQIPYILIVMPSGVHKYITQYWAIYVCSELLAAILNGIF